MTTRNNLKRGFGGRSFNHSLIENINGAQKFLSAVWISFRLGRFPFRLFLYLSSFLSFSLCSLSINFCSSTLVLCIPLFFCYLFNLVHSPSV